MELDFAILLRLLLAHIISDFLLQSNWMKEGKKSKWKSQWRYQVGHSLIHAAISYILVAQCNNWIIPLVIFVSHLIIDIIKSNYFKDRLCPFIIDQIAHIIVILLLWFFMLEELTPTLDWIEKTFTSNQPWVIIIAYILVLKPTSIMLNLFFKPWKLTSNSESLPNAGEWIGYMERILILTFIINNNIEAVGFLLAAKSVFRFGELKDTNQIKRTEYVLLGTLASFSIAIILGLIINWAY